MEALSAARAVMRAVAASATGHGARGRRGAVEAPACDEATADEEDDAHGHGGGEHCCERGDDDAQGVGVVVGLGDEEVDEVDEVDPEDRLRARERGISEVIGTRKHA